MYSMLFNVYTSMTSSNLHLFGLNIFISQIDTYMYNNYKHYK